MTTKDNNTMTTKQFTCTLTRWHKVSERLTKEYVQIFKALQSSLTATTVTEYLGESQELRLNELRDKSLGQIDSAFAIYDTVAQIRTALGSANEREGVSKALAEYDRLTKRSALLKTLAATDGDRVRIDELKNIKAVPRSGGFLDRGQTKIQVQMLEGEALERLTQLARETTVAMYALTDRIAELNKATLTLELPLVVASLAGLSAQG